MKLPDSKKKVTRVRTGCWTCKQRRRKCDETKPECRNCLNTGRKCEGYGIRLTFNKNNSRTTTGSGATKEGITIITQRDFSSNGSSKTNSTPLKKETDLIISMNKESNSSTSSKETNIITESESENDPTPIANTNNTDITDPYQFESALYGGLDYLLSFPMQSEKNLLSGTNSLNIPTDTTSHENDQNNSLSPLTPSIFEYLESQRDSPNPMNLSNITNGIGNTSIGYNGNGNGNTNFNLDLSTFIDNTNLYPSIQPTNEEDDYELVNPQHRQQLLMYHKQFSNNNQEDQDKENDNNNDNTNNSKLYANDIKSLSNTLEDKMMLKHFFDKLLPLLDSHPNSPWPELALKYCDIEIARSCFISLSCIHLYEQGGENEFYKRGMLHINNTMEYLVKYMKSNQRKDYYMQLQQHQKQQQKQQQQQQQQQQQAQQQQAQQQQAQQQQAQQQQQPVKKEKPINEQSNDGITISKIVDNLKDESDNEKQKQTNFFVILLLIYVHLLFGILESGRSALSRVFLSLFASISEDKTFQKVMSRIDQSQTLICVLSWFDTICAVISPDCRLPYCNPLWYGKKNDLISTAKMNGCPGEIFESIAEICKIRHDLKNGKLKNHLDLSIKFERVKFQILNYRDYVPLELINNNSTNTNNTNTNTKNKNLSYSYEDRLHGAQCWSLATYIKLLEVCKIDQPDTTYEMTIEQCIKEFIITYKTLNSNSPIRTQMVWPIFLVATKCTKEEDQVELMKFMNKLYETVKMGTIITMIKIVNQVWETGLTSEEILGGKEWLSSGIDYLPI